VWSVFRRNFEESLITGIDCRAVKDIVKDISIRGDEGWLVGLNLVKVPRGTGKGSKSSGENVATE
jgi:hypothetical protein